MSTTCPARPKHGSKWAPVRDTSGSARALTQVLSSPTALHHSPLGKTSGLASSEDYFKNWTKIAQRSEASGLENGQEQREFRQPEPQPNVISLSHCTNDTAPATSGLWILYLWPPSLLALNQACGGSLLPLFLPALPEWIIRSLCPNCSCKED